MNAPAALLSFFIASGLALLFHFVRGGGFGRLILFLATSWATFFAGHYAGLWLDWTPLRLGSINIFSAVLAALLGLLIANFLAGPERRTPRRPPPRKPRR